jgi:hypothetical protein
MIVPMVNRLFTLSVYHGGREEGDLTMIGILMFAAAANAPAMLAARDETQWRTFVRASLQRPAAPRGLRLKQLQGTVRALGDDRRPVQVAGPSGL